MSFIIEDYSTQNDDLLKNESLFHVANGYLGVRGNFEEGYSNAYATIRGTYINAFHEVNKIQYSERLHGAPETKQAILNVIDAQTIELFIGDEKFSLFEGEVLNYRRTFNLGEGYTLREIHWKSPRGHEFKIQIKRMASFYKLELFLISYEIQSINYSGKIKIISKVNGDVANFSSSDDPRVSSELIKALQVKKVSGNEKLVSILAQTKNSRLSIACNVYHGVSCPNEAKLELADKSIDLSINANIEKMGKVVLDKFAIYTDSLRHVEPGERGAEICMEISKEPAAFYFEKQKEYLMDFWNNSEVIIGGNELLQQGIHYNIYQLLQSVGKDSYSNISAKGLSGEGYEGHYFWDTEIYMFPFFLLTAPLTAKNLLMYRYGILNEARKNARALGHNKGALYPWRTITGGECSGYFPAGTAQYHINADIAYSFIKYYQVTEDMEFMINYGAEVLFETARLWLDTGHFQGELFKIDAVTGPDEYTAIVNNNYYTNVLAKYNLKWAVRIYYLLDKDHKAARDRVVERIRLEEKEVNEWERAYKKMYLPYNKELDINPQDDSFLNKEKWNIKATPRSNFPLLLNYHPLLLYRYQVCKQADTILAHFLQEDEQEFSTIKNSFDYYEQVTTHDSSLSSCIFSIMASKVGYSRSAYDYFIQSARLDMDDTHGNTKDGIHTANMGGSYLSIVYGFAGLRIKENGIFFNPQTPQEWTEYKFKINYKNRLIAININKKEIIFTLEKGAAIDINLAAPVRIVRLGYDDNSKVVKCKLEEAAN
jgi:alpha,alpha-trehalose phosphorylase